MNPPTKLLLLLLLFQSAQSTRPDYDATDGIPSADDVAEGIPANLDDADEGIPAADDVTAEIPTNLDDVTAGISEEEDFLSSILLDPNELMPDLDLPKDSKELRVVEGKADLENETETGSVKKISGNTLVSPLMVDRRNGFHGNAVTARSCRRESRRCRKFWKAWKQRRNSKYGNRDGHELDVHGNRNHGDRNHSNRNHSNRTTVQPSNFKRRRDALRLPSRTSRRNPDAKMRAFCARVDKISPQDVKQERLAYVEKKLARLPEEKSQQIREAWIAHRRELQKCCKLAEDDRKSCADEVKLIRIKQICDKKVKLCPFIEYHLGDKAKTVEKDFLNCCNANDDAKKLECFNKVKADMQRPNKMM